MKKIQQQLMRLANATFPVHLPSSTEIETARRSKNLGYLNVAIPPMSKGRNNYGEQRPAVVRAITPAGRKLLEDLIKLEVGENRTSAPKS